jgi:mono/diheme cytochrome c family protein
MRWTRRIAEVAVASSVLLAIFAISCARQQQSAEPPKAAMDPLARGRYLVSVVGCGDCHTPGTLYGLPDTTRLLSGSELGWEGPWGLSYPRNLTPDEETGIGTWSEEDIVQTLRTGKRKDGSPLLPPMPWPDIAMMSDEDLHAVAVYLKSIPAVKHKMPPALPPTAKHTGPRLTMPPPPAWDAQHMPPPAAPAGK